MSDTPRTDKVKASVMWEYLTTQYEFLINHARTLERELADAKAQQYALAKNFADMQERMADAAKQRDEAREYLQDAIKCYVEQMSWPMREDLAQWRKAAGLERAK